MAPSNPRGGAPKEKRSKKKAEPIEPPFARLLPAPPASTPAFEPVAFAPVLDAALRAGEVASLIIAMEGLDPSARQVAAERLVPIAQANGTAAIVTDRALLDHCGADGLHVDTGLADLRRAGRCAAPGPHRRPAAAFTPATTPCCSPRRNANYLFFGRFDGDTAPVIHDKTLDLAAWWSALFEIPAIVMGGSDLASIGEAAAARVEFIALRSAIWTHPDGPAAAIESAHRLVLAAQAETMP